MCVGRSKRTRNLLEKRLRDVPSELWAGFVSSHRNSSNPAPSQGTRFFLRLGKLIICRGGSTSVPSTLTPLLSAANPAANRPGDSGSSEFRPEQSISEEKPSPRSNPQNWSRARRRKFGERREWVLENLREVSEREGMIPRFPLGSHLSVPVVESFSCEIVSRQRERPRELEIKYSHNRTQGGHA